MAEKKTWVEDATCPKCGTPARVRWIGFTAWGSGGLPIRATASDFECDNDCRMTLAELDEHFPRRRFKKKIGRRGRRGDSRPEAQ